MDMCEVPKKEERRTRHCLQEPPQRGARNSTRPTPLAGRGQALPSWDTRAGVPAQGCGFLGEQFSTHAESSGFIVVLVRPRSGSVYPLLLKVRFVGSDRPDPSTSLRWLYRSC